MTGVKWASTRENVPSDIAPNRLKISLCLNAVWSVFVVHMKEFCILGYPKCAKSRFWSYFVNVQADHNLHWTHTPQPLYNTIVGVHSINPKQKCIGYIEKWPFMVIFQHNLYIFGILLWTVLYPKPYYNELCKQKCIGYIEKWPFMVIFQYNLYIFGIHL